MGEAAHRLRHAHEQGRAQEHTAHAAGPADEDHDEQVDGQERREVRRAHDRRVVRVEDPGGGGKRTAGREERQLVPERVDAERGRELLVALDHRDRAADAIGRESEVREEGRAGEERGEDVGRPGRRRRQHQGPERQPRGGDPGGAHRAAGEVGQVVGQGGGDEPEAEAADREGEVRQAEERPADGDRDHRGERGAGHQRDEEPGVVPGGEDARGVGADRVEGRRGERHRADVAGHQVERQREHDVERERHQGVRRVRRRHEPGGGDRGREEGDGQGDAGRPHYARAARPARPCGRARSTSTMTAKPIASW